VPERTPTLGELLPLTHLSFLILLALARKNLHGYAIIKAIQKQWGTTINPGTGTFYSALRRMKGELLVEDIDPLAEAGDEDQRRRYYAITDLGRQALQAETRRLEDLVSEVKSLELLPGENA